MKTSVSMYSLNQYVRKHGWSIFDFIDYAKEIGADGVELLDTYWKDQDQEIEEVINYLKEKELCVSAYDTSNNFVQLSPEDRKVETDRVIKAIKTAKQLNTDVVRVFCGNLKDGVEYNQGRKWIIESFKRCIKEAEKEKVYLAIENHGLLAGSNWQVKELIKEFNSPYLKSTLDTGNFLLVENDPLESTRLLKEDVVHVHFKDFIKKESDYVGKSFISLNGDKYVGVAAGEGLVDLKAIIEELKSVEYDGWLSIEYEGDDDARECVRRSISKLNNLTSRVNKAGEYTELTYGNVLEIARQNKAVDCTLEKAIDFIKINQSPKLNKVIFSFDRGWKSRPEVEKITQIMNNKETGENGILRLMCRFSDKNNERKSDPLYYTLVRELGFISTHFTNISRLHTRRVKNENYDHIIVTIRFKDKKIAQLEVVCCNDITEVYEIDYAGDQGTIYYRNEPLSPFMYEPNTAFYRDHSEKNNKTYTFYELKNALQLTDIIYSTLDSDFKVIALSEVMK